MERCTGYHGDSGEEPGATSPGRAGQASRRRCYRRWDRLASWYHRPRSRVSKGTEMKNREEQADTPGHESGWDHFRSSQGEAEKIVKGPGKEGVWPGSWTQMCPAGSGFSVSAPAACSMEDRQEGPAESSLCRARLCYAGLGEIKLRGNDSLKTFSRCQSPFLKHIK